MKEKRGRTVTVNAQEIAERAVAECHNLHGGPAAFDYYTAVHGVEPFGRLYNEVYVIANEDQPPVQAGDREEIVAARKERARQLWEEVLPHLEEYASRCRQRKYLGWSRASGGPIRYADEQE